MKEFGMTFLLLLIGALLVLFGQGVTKARSEGDAFRFDFFLKNNFNRLALLGFGLIVIALGLYFDPVGLEAIFETLPITVKIFSPMVVGAGVSGLVLILPTNKVKKPEE